MISFSSPLSLSWIWMYGWVRTPATRTVRILGLTSLTIKTDSDHSSPTIALKRVSRELLMLFTAINWGIGEVCLNQDT